MKHKIISIFIITILLFQCTSFSNSIYVWSENESDTTQVNSNPSDENFLNLESESAILIEQTTGKVLYEKDPHKQLRPASVTKVMSILLIMEALDEGKISLQDKVPCSENASSMGGSQIWLNPTEELTVDEMLKAICVVSANDCVVAMAEFLAGSEEQFVKQMNDKAKELEMNDTYFKNCHGIDEDGHLTSSYDIALMSKELLNKYPSITNYTTIWMDTLRDGTSELSNTNKLVKTYKGCTGLKTGSTSLALYNLSASATRGNMSLIAVILRAPSTKIRFSEAKKLLDYGFSNFSFIDLATKDKTVQNVMVSKGTKNNVNLVFENNYGTIIKNGEDKNITQEIIVDENISAPVKKGDVLGKVNFYNTDNELIGSVNLISDSNIDKNNIWGTFKYLSSKWFRLLR